MEQEQENAEEAEKEPLFSASNVRQAVLRSVFAGLVFTVLTGLLAAGGVILAWVLFLCIAIGPLSLVEFGSSRGVSSRLGHLRVTAEVFVLGSVLVLIGVVQAIYTTGLVGTGQLSSGVNNAAKMLEKMNWELGAFLLFTTPISLGFAAASLAHLRALGFYKRLFLVSVPSAILAGMLTFAIAGGRNYPFPLFPSVAAFVLPLIYAAAERIDQAWIRRCSQD